MRIALFFLALFVFAVTGCYRGEGREAFDRGNRLLKSGRPGDLELSVQYFKKSIELEMRARNQLVTAYKRLARKNIRDAGWGMKEGALDRHVKSRAAAQAGVSAISLRLYNTAVRYLKEAVKLTPDDKFVHFHLAVCYARLSLSAPTLGERGLVRRQAVASYKTALRIDRKYDAAAYGLAFVRMSRGKYAEAVKVLQGIMARNPGSSRIYFVLARCYYEMKQYAKAETMYRVLLDLLPSSSPKLETVRRNIVRLRQMR